MLPLGEACLSIIETVCKGSKRLDWEENSRRAIVTPGFATAREGQQEEMFGLAGECVFNRQEAACRPLRL